MPKGVYPRTEYHRKIISKSSLGRKHTEEYKIRQSLMAKQRGFGKWMTGKKRPQEVIDKIIKNHRRHQTLETRAKISAIHKGKPSWKKGTKLSEETRKRMSLARIGKYGGDKSPGWRGGKSFESYGLEFNNSLREQIRIRDNLRCQECFRHQDELRTETNRPYKLNVHHIDYDKKNNNQNNLISLCRNCHMQTNFNRDDWTRYFTK